MSQSKDAAKIAARVRERGFDCECADGHAFIVKDRRSGQVLARFSAHSANLTAIWKIESDLRSKGILPPKEHWGKKEEPEVPAEEEGMTVSQAAPERITDEQRQELQRRLRERLSQYGLAEPTARTQLARDAADLIASGRVEADQFGAQGSGKSAPEMIAREAIRVIVDKNASASPVSFVRWMKVLDFMDEQDSSGNGHRQEEIGSGVEPEPERAVPEPPATEPEEHPAPVEETREEEGEAPSEPELPAGPSAEERATAELARQVHDAQETARVAESLLKDSEEEATMLRARLTEVEDEVAAFREQAEGWKRQHDVEKARADVAEQRVVELAQAVEQVEAKLESAREQMLSSSAGDAEAQQRIAELEGQNANLQRALDEAAARLEGVDDGEVGDGEAIPVMGMPEGVTGVMFVQRMSAKQLYMMSLMRFVGEFDFASEKSFAALEPALQRIDQLTREIDAEQGTEAGQGDD